MHTFRRMRADLLQPVEKLLLVSKVTVMSFQLLSLYSQWWTAHVNTADSSGAVKWSVTSHFVFVIIIQ